MTFPNGCVIAGIKEFSLMKGFSFAYLDFRKWEAKETEKTGENECSIWLNWPLHIKFEVAPRIVVAKISQKHMHQNSGAARNPQMASYKFVYDPTLYVKGHVPKEGEWDYIEFYGRDAIVRITPFTHEGDGYSCKAFVEHVIRSFRFV